MAQPLRSPKDQGEQSQQRGQDFKDGWLERIFHCLHGWRNERQEAEAIDRLTARIESMFEWFKSSSNFVTKYDLRELKEEIMATQAELAADLKAVLAQQQKTAAEIASVQAAQTLALEKIAELEALIAAGGEVTPELVQAVADVKAQAQVVDELIPDLPVEPPVEPPIP